MDYSEEIGSWAESADRSLTASLLLGRDSARSIAKAHLSELIDWLRVIEVLHSRNIESEQFWLAPFVNGELQTNFFSDL